MAIQSDQEHAVKAITQQVSTQLGVPTRFAAVHSSQSQGSIERLHSTLFSQVRALREQLFADYQLRIGADHTVLPWLVRQSAWLVTRYLKNTDGLTPYERRWGRQCSSPLARFGETVTYRLTPVAAHLHPRGKLESSWETGLWLGRTTDSNECIIGTSNGVVRTRSIKESASHSASKQATA